MNIILGNNLQHLLPYPLIHSDIEVKERNNVASYDNTEKAER
jgi:hypothetical protein